MICRTGDVLKNVNTGETAEVCLIRADGYVCQNVGRNLVVPHNSKAWIKVNRMD